MRIFEMDDCTWWMAPTLEDAVDDYLKETGQKREEVLGRGEDPHEISGAEYDTLIFVEDEGDGVQRTFREELDRRLAAGDTAAQMFASTEY